MQTPRRRSRPAPPVFPSLLVTLGLGAALSALGLVIAFTAFQVWYAGRVFPGITVDGVPLQGLNYPAAALRLLEQFDYPTRGRLLIRDRDRSWLVKPADLGLALEPEASAEAAFNTGRSGGLFHSLREQLDCILFGRRLPPVLVFDQRAAYAYLAGLAAQVDYPVIEAGVTLNGTEVSVHSGETGRRVDIDATLAQMTPLLQSRQDGVLDLVIRETPPLIVDASAQAELARRILSQPLTLTLPAGSGDAQASWVFDTPTLAAMLSIEPVQSEGAARYQVTLNSNILHTYLTNLAPTLNITPQNARFTFNDKTRKLDLIQPSVTGRTLDVELTLRNIQEKLIAGEHTISLEFAHTPPSVKDDATGENLGIRELVQSQTSYFYGSSESRIQNIRTAAERFHGLLVPPHTAFSMAQALGNISLDNGYAEALIIYGGRTIQGVGGGVCQVSTTLFRTVFFAGFPVIERNAHAYRVSYYEKIAGNRSEPRLAGLDATVFVPLVDFKFDNPTDSWLLMETYVSTSASSITWKFYSTSDGRKVDWQTTGPENPVPAPEPLYKENPDLPANEIKKVDWEAEGADVTVHRTVNLGGDVLFRDTFTTHYQPWQAVYEYGPGTENIPTPASPTAEP